MNAMMVIIPNHSVRFAVLIFRWSLSAHCHTSTSKQEISEAFEKNILGPSNIRLLALVVCDVMNGAPCNSTFDYRSPSESGRRDSSRLQNPVEGFQRSAAVERGRGAAESEPGEEQRTPPSACLARSCSPFGRVCHFVNFCEAENAPFASLLKGTAWMVTCAARREMKRQIPDGDEEKRTNEKKSGTPRRCCSNSIFTRR